MCPSLRLSHSSLTLVSSPRKFFSNLSKVSTLDILAENKGTTTATCTYKMDPRPSSSISLKVNPPAPEACPGVKQQTPTPVRASSPRVAALELHCTSLRRQNLNPPPSPTFTPNTRASEQIGLAVCIFWGSYGGRTLIGWFWNEGGVDEQDIERLGGNLSIADMYIFIKLPEVAIVILFATSSSGRESEVEGSQAS
jgi:hypothetical protein